MFFLRFLYLQYGKLGKTPCFRNKKSSAANAEDKKFLWYHLSLPLAGPHGILIDPQAVSGPTRLRLLYFSKAAPKGIPYPDPHCLAPTGSSLAKPCGYVLVFIIALSVSVKHKFTTGGRASQ